MLESTWYNFGETSAVEKALGKISYEISEEQKRGRVFRRSLFVVKNVKEDEEFSEANVKSIRPGFGLHPRYLSCVYGKKAKFDIEMGTPLKWKYTK